MSCRNYWLFAIIALNCSACFQSKISAGKTSSNTPHVTGYITQISGSEKSKNFIGPLEENLPFAGEEATTDTVCIEKGGKNTYVAPYIARLKPEKGTDKYSAAELMKKADSLKTYAKANGYNTSIAMLVNMKMKSGKRRFFVVNLATHQIIASGLVAHGRGNEPFTFDKQFSNDPGSNCTSLGMYKIGKSYNGNFGLSYRLYGLDKNNSNAFKRFVVLHAMNCIPDKESAYPICQTEGCPAVSSSFLKQLGGFIDKSNQPILLWLYD